MIEITILLTISLLANVLLLYYYLTEKDHHNILKKYYDSSREVIRVQAEQLKYLKGIR